MTDQEREVIESATRGIEAAMTWLEADIRRLERALAHGIPLELIGQLNRIAMKAREGK